VYPTRYQLQELTSHVVAALERRRQGFPEWNADVEAKLTEEAKTVLAEAGRQFAEVADDKPYWEQLERTVLTAALPRYFQVAKEEHQHEKDKYGLWRGGDLVSRAAYAGIGLLVAVIVLRTALPDWLEPLPLAFFIGGPMLPDLQIWFARRKYAAKLRALVDDMRDEAAARAQYRPLMEGAPAPIDTPAAAEAERVKNPTKTQGES
jgi:hypothetical protein